MPNSTDTTLSFIERVRLTRRILYALNTKDELKGLITWAQRKRLPQVRDNYLDKCLGVTRKLLLLELKYPREYTKACWWRQLKNLLSVRPHYVPGMAQRYRAWSQHRDGLTPSIRDHMPNLSFKTKQKEGTPYFKR